MARVLIVDDVDFMITMYKDMLKLRGHEVIGVAFNGNEAIEKYVELRPDMVIMDVLMPEMDGLAALEKILEIDPDARVMVVTALGQPTIKEECLQAGARAFMGKPFEEEPFFATLTKMLGENAAEESTG